MECVQRGAVQIDTKYPLGLPRHPAHGEDIGLLSILEINMEFIEQEGSPNFSREGSTRGSCHSIVYK